jgi:hypothetical protein
MYNKLNPTGTPPARTYLLPITKHPVLYQLLYSGVAGGIEVVNAHPRLYDHIIPLVSEAREPAPEDLLIGLYSAAPGRELLLMGGG